MICTDPAIHPARLAPPAAPHEQAGAGGGVEPAERMQVDDDDDLQFAAMDDDHDPNSVTERPSDATKRYAEDLTTFGEELDALLSDESEQSD